MISKHTKDKSLATILARMLIGLFVFGIVIGLSLRSKNIAVFNSAGSIASQQRHLIIFAGLVVLAVAIPTLTVLYFMAWRYRDSNTKSSYQSEDKTGKFFNITIWAFPTAVMLLLAIVLVPATSRLQPSKAIASGAQPITIQVMAMRWKWLFIYPAQNIATVNFVQIPKDVPVVFTLTADEAPMSSFWVPNLGGQLYAMTGHINRLNLIADRIGDFQGRSAEINGAGFEGMKFTARVSSEEDFQSWVRSTQRTPAALDTSAYANLLKPSENNKAEMYSPVDASLYSAAVMKYMGSHNHQMTELDHGVSH